MFLYVGATILLDAIKRLRSVVTLYVKNVPKISHNCIIELISKWWGYVTPCPAPRMAGFNAAHSTGSRSSSTVGYSGDSHCIYQAAWFCTVVSVLACRLSPCLTSMQKGRFSKFGLKYEGTEGLLRENSLHCTVRCGKAPGEGCCRSLWWGRNPGVFAEVVLFDHPIPSWSRLQEGQACQAAFRRGSWGEQASKFHGDVSWVNEEPALKEHEHRSRDPIRTDLWR